MATGAVWLGAAASATGCDAFAPMGLLASTGEHSNDGEPSALARKRSGAVLRVSTGGLVPTGTSPSLRLCVAAVCNAARGTGFCQNVDALVHQHIDAKCTLIKSFNCVSSVDDVKTPRRRGQRMVQCQ